MFVLFSGLFCVSLYCLLFVYYLGCLVCVIVLLFVVYL